MDAAASCTASGFCATGICCLESAGATSGRCIEKSACTTLHGLELCEATGRCQADVSDASTCQPCGRSGLEGCTGSGFTLCVDAGGPSCTASGSCSTGICCLETAGAASGSCVERSVCTSIGGAELCELNSRCQSDVGDASTCAACGTGGLEACTGSTFASKCN